MYVIEINGHEVFVEVEFGPQIAVGYEDSGESSEYPEIEKVNVVTGFSANGDYITEVAPEWLREMIQDPNLLLYDILEQDGPETADEFDSESWACFSLGSK